MRRIVMLAAAAFAAGPALAQDVGLVKVAKGSVAIERDGRKLEAAVGTPVRPADTLITGTDGSAGVTFADNSLVSVGPGSIFVIDRYRFDSTTHAGQFDGTLRKGKLAAVSGNMVRQAPGSMTIRTPASVMAVRGTEFVVQVDEPVR